MKKSVCSFVFVISVISHSVFAQTADTLYEIAVWSGFSQSAVTYTWDDNTAKQLSDALPLYDRYGFKLTFFPITSASPDWTGLKQAQNKGHEIASHTVTHASLASLPDSVQESEQKNSQAEINLQLMNSRCVTIAYPYCAPGNKNITSNYYISARGCNGQIENKTPADFFNVGAIICGPQGSVSTAAQFNNSVTNAAAINGWAVFLLHGINNDGGFSPVDSSELGRHLEYMNYNRDKYWIDTYRNVVRYIRERNDAVVQEVTNSDSLILFSLHHSLDTSIYNLPLTLKRLLPEHWLSFSVSQNGALLTTKLTEEKGKKFVVFDALANTGNIVMKNLSSTTHIVENSIATSFTIQPNPLEGVSAIRFELEQGSVISLELLEESGKRIRTIAKGYYAAGSYEVVLDATGLQRGIFYCTLSVRGKVLVKKVICKK